MNENDSQEFPPEEIERRAQEVVQRYLAALHAGEVVDQAEWVARYPDLGAVLAARLAEAEARFHASGKRSAGTPPDWKETETRQLEDLGSAALNSAFDQGDGTDEMSSSADTRAASPSEVIQAERALGMRCPHCGQRLQLTLPNAEEITCSNCGHSFICNMGRHTLSSQIQQPEQIDRFVILDTLGRGGFGIVYKARDPRLSRIVAIKVPRAGYFSTEQDEMRFLREAQSAAHLRHPHIVRIHEVDRFHGIPYIVSEYIEGRTLRDLIKHQRLSFGETVELLVQVADALEYAHQKKVVHRDIKPSNILIDESWQAYVADFGLARRDDTEITVTIDGQVLGTPAYMAPEQAAGDMHAVDQRSDVYSLGVVLYRAICGELPFHGTRRMLINQVMHDEPKPPRHVNELVPVDLETITLKAMAKEPERRYPSAREFADDLRRWSNDEPIRARPIGKGARFVRWCRRNPLIATLNFVIMFLLLAVAVVSATWAWREIALRFDADTARRQAEANAAESRKRLVAIHLREGVDRMNEHDYFTALSWFAQALRTDNGNPTTTNLHRLRIGMTFSRCPQLWRQWIGPAGLKDVLFSTDGQHVLVSADDGSMAIWDVASEKRTGGIGAQGGVQTCAALSPAGDRFVSGGTNMTAFIWNVSTSTRMATLKHTKMIVDTEFSPDGKMVATAGLDAIARVWNAESGALIAELKQPLDLVSTCIFSPDGERLLVVCSPSEAAGQMQLWNPRTGKPIGNVMRHDGYIWGVEFSADGQRIVSASRDRTVRVWDGNTGKPVGVPMRHDMPLRRVFFLDGTKRVVSVSMDSRICVWDVETGTQLRSAGTDAARRLRHAVISRLRRLLALLRTNGTVEVWTLPALQRVGPLLPSTGTVTAIAFGSSDRVVVTADQNGTVRI